MTIEETKNKIVEYIQILEPTLEISEALLFEVEELIDRVLIHTYRVVVPKELNKVLAKSIVGMKRKEKEAIESMGEISSITDNGQSISFRAQTNQYNGYETMNEAMFNDLKSVLDKYVKATVVGEERDEFINRQTK